MSRLVSVTSYSIALHLREEGASIFSVSSDEVVVDSRKVSPQPSFLQAEQTQSPQCSGPPTSWAALHRARSILPISFLYQGSHSWTRYSRSSLMNANHDSLSPSVKPFFHLFHHPLIHFIGHQFGDSKTMGDCIRSLAKVRVYNIQCPLLVLGQAIILVRNELPLVNPRWLLPVRFLSRCYDQTFILVSGVPNTISYGHTLNSGQAMCKCLLHINVVGGKKILTLFLSFVSFLSVQQSHLLRDSLVLFQIQKYVLNVLRGLNQSTCLAGKPGHPFQYKALCAAVYSHSM